MLTHTTLLRDCWRWTHPAEAPHPASRHPATPADRCIQNLKADRVVESHPCAQNAQGWGTRVHLRIPVV